MNPPDVEHCRVLEIGCGDGNNLIPIALSLPNSHFVGIDLSAVAIEKGSSIASRVGLTNIRLECRDLLEDLSEFGEFDYIIAHGFYSWVPQQVQKRLLSFCDGCLSRDGIVFISYNTYPGCHLREAIRDLMLFDLGQSKDGSENRAQRARGFLNTIARCAPAKTLWKSFLESESARLSKRDDRLMFHDELNEHYSPVYFSAFVAAARLDHLQFLGEAKLRDTLVPSLDVEAVQELRELAGPDVIAFEQYLDFALFQAFRRTLLCRERVALNRDGPKCYLADLFIASPLRVSNTYAHGAVRFVNSRAAGQIETNDAVVISALKRLELAWPKAEPFAVLLDHSCRDAPGSSVQEAKTALVEAFLELSKSGLLDLRTYSGSAASELKARPEASPLSRLQAQQDSTVTTLLHTNVEIKDASARQVLAMLDGSSGVRDLARKYRPGRHSELPKVEAELRYLIAEFKGLGLLTD